MFELSNFLYIKTMHLKSTCKRAVLNGGMEKGFKGLFSVSSVTCEIAKAKEKKNKL